MLKNCFIQDSYILSAFDIFFHSFLSSLCAVYKTSQSLEKILMFVPSFMPISRILSRIVSNIWQMLDIFLYTRLRYHIHQEPSLMYQSEDFEQVFHKCTAGMRLLQGFFMCQFSLFDGPSEKYLLEVTEEPEQRQRSGYRERFCTHIH